MKSFVNFYLKNNTYYFYFFNDQGGLLPSLIFLIQISKSIIKIIYIFIWINALKQKKNMYLELFKKMI
jgi:hypothetical protein